MKIIFTFHIKLFILIKTHFIPLFTNCANCPRGVRDDLRKNQFFPRRFAQTYFSNEKVCAICKKWNLMCSFQKSIFLMDCAYQSHVDIIAIIQIHFFLHKRCCVLLFCFLSYPKIYGMIHPRDCLHHC